MVLLDLSTVGANSRIFLVDVQDSSSHVSRKQVLDVHKCKSVSEIGRSLHISVSLYFICLTIIIEFLQYLRRF